MAEAELRSRLQEEIAAKKKLQQENAVLTRDKSRLAQENDELHAKVRALTTTREKLEELARLLQTANKEAVAAAEATRKEYNEKYIADQIRTQELMSNAANALQKALEESESMRAAVISQNGQIDMLRKQLEAVTRDKESSMKLAFEKVEEARRLSQKAVDNADATAAAYATALKTNDELVKQNDALRKDNETMREEVEKAMLSEFAKLRAVHQSSVDALHTRVTELHKENARLVTDGQIRMRALEQRDATIKSLSEKLRRVDSLETATTRLSNVCRGLQAETRGLREVLGKVEAEMATAMEHVRRVEAGEGGDDSVPAIAACVRAAAHTCTAARTPATAPATPVSTATASSAGSPSASHPQHPPGEGEPAPGHDVSTSQRARMSGVASTGSRPASPEETVEEAAPAADTEQNGAS